MHSQNPTSLPLDLEREIFELTARLYPPMAPILLRVAHRVFVWIEPLIYETLVLHESSLHRSLIFALRTNPTSPQSVRNLWFGDYGDKKRPEKTELVFSVCSGVRNLALLNPRPALLPYIAAMKLQRFFGRLEELFLPMPVDFSISLFSTITHLDVFYTHIGEQMSVAGLAACPALTHLHLYMEKPNTLHEILLVCKKLQVLIHTVTHSLQAGTSTIKDVRLVSLERTGNIFDAGDWKAGTRGERNSWARAELFVTKRRRGEVHPASRSWIEASDMIL
ncbi:hypothetical protein C8R44DRAFT_811548 [Mycena epipterygia]|nr:hypothetical protein C8R44DRAFT_811548 [Mycena epipterygia]